MRFIAHAAVLVLSLSGCASPTTPPLPSSGAALLPLGAPDSIPCESGEGPFAFVAQHGGGITNDDHWGGETVSREGLLFAIEVSRSTSGGEGKFDGSRLAGVSEAEVEARVVEQGWGIQPNATVRSAFVSPLGPDYGILCTAIMEDFFRIPARDDNPGIDDGGGWSAEARVSTGVHAVSSYAGGVHPANARFREVFDEIVSNGRKAAFASVE